MPAGRPKVAILGGGISGLTLARRLSAAGCEVELLEAEPQLGGLGTWFEWRGLNIDRFYHCQMPSDGPLLALIEELRLTESMVWKNTRMGFIVEGVRYPFNGALDLLRFKALTFMERIRFGAVSLILRPAGKGKDLDNIPVGEWLSGLYGGTLWKKMLEPLFRAKFGDAAANLPALYIWSRLGRESNKALRGYLKGGLKAFIDRFAKVLMRSGVNLRTSSRIAQVTQEDDGVHIVCADGYQTKADWAVSTLPFPVLRRVLEGKAKAATESLPDIPYQGVVNALFFLRRPLDNLYWSPVMRSGTDFDGLVEMTELIDTSHYGGHHVAYTMRYTPQNSALFAEDETSIAERWISQLLPLYKDINLTREDIVDVKIFKAPYVEPLYPLGYASTKPGFDIEGTNLMTASTAQVYPGITSWNSAVTFANEAATHILGRIKAAQANKPPAPKRELPAPPAARVLVRH